MSKSKKKKLSNSKKNHSLNPLWRSQTSKSLNQKLPDKVVLNECMDEVDLTNYLRNNPPTLFPLRIGDQWQVKPGRADLGEGDLIFGKIDLSEFMVIEVKYLSQPKRGKKAKLVVQQARKYAKAVFDETKKKTVGCTFTNVNGLQQICIFEEKDKSVR
jgi:hypothetical protein